MTGSMTGCSCSFFSLHGRCEHTTFVSSISIRARAPLINLDKLPAASHGRGRKRKPTPGLRKQRSSFKKIKKTRTKHCPQFLRCLDCLPIVSLILQASMMASPDLIRNAPCKLLFIASFLLSCYVIVARRYFQS